MREGGFGYRRAVVVGTFMHSDCMGFCFCLVLGLYQLARMDLV